MKNDPTVELNFFLLIYRYMIYLRSLKIIFFLLVKFTQSKSVLSIQSL